MDLGRKKFTLQLAGRPLTLEVSRLAGQANAAVLGTYGETTVLVTAVMSDKERTVNYMPLTVDYEEKFYAAGKIIGSRFIRREGRPSEEAILSGRLVDRALRPLFDSRIRRDIQIVVTILSIDEENDPDLVSLITASAALLISDIPWSGPVAGVRVAKIGDEFVLNPLQSQLKTDNGVLYSFETFVAGVEDRINMIELSGDEAPESDVIKAFEVAQKEVAKIVAFQKQIAKEVGKPKTTITLLQPKEELVLEVKKFLADKLDGAVYVTNKKEQHGNLDELKSDLLYHLRESEFSGEDLGVAELLFDEEVDAIVHKNILASERRPDERKLDQVRDLYAEVGTLPRTHGSAVFVRGDTQALAVATIAPPGAEQMIETMEFSGKRRFMLHYNFPSYSVGETGSYRGPGRRDIGHGALAEKALKPLIPLKEDFPYTIRVVSEILSSNGSSSMATVCAGSLALMDAGVPIRKPAAGIAMGLMSDDKGNYKVLTDIQGPEDHYGDMDFKVAGTDAGVNAVQMDVKVQGVTLEILGKTLLQAKAARLHILKTITGVLSAPRPNLSPYAPRVYKIQIDSTRIGELVGPGGKVINGIIAATGVTSIDIEQTGIVYVSAPKEEAAQAALSQINAIFKEYQIGEIVEGVVEKVLEFGAIVDLGAGRSGMIHVSELKNGFVKKVEDVVRLGDRVRAMVIRIEDGKMGLSIKRLEEGAASQKQ